MRPVMTDDQDEVVVEDMQMINLAEATPIDHVFDYIVGNQLTCRGHGGNCPIITVAPTQVLEFDTDGRLQLVDKAPGR